MNVHDLIQEQPKFHIVGDGELVSLALHPDTLLYLGEHVQANAKTLETGAGASTVVFAMKGAEHICITPDQGQIDRITAYCREKQISLDKVRFIADKSERALPRLTVNDLDLVLVDGRHAFPTPFIDWFYTADKLKIGGRMILDDIAVWPVAMLRDFMVAEPEWTLDKTLTKSQAFLKVQEENHEKWFGLQGYVMRNSEPELIRLHLDRAFTDYRRGDLHAGNQEVAYVHANAPSLTGNARALANEIINRAWPMLLHSTAHRQETLRLVGQVYDQLPPGGFRARARRYTLAALHAALAFHCHNQGATGATRADVLRAYSLEPRLLLNRGLLSILVKSFRPRPAPQN